MKNIKILSTNKVTPKKKIFKGSETSHPNIAEWSKRECSSKVETAATEPAS